MPPSNNSPIVANSSYLTSPSLTQQGLLHLLQSHTTALIQKSGQGNIPAAVVALTELVKVFQAWMQSTN